jgi:hypothetical protein
MAIFMFGMAAVGTMLVKSKDRRVIKEIRAIPVHRATKVTLALKGTKGTKARRAIKVTLVLKATKVIKVLKAFKGTKARKVTKAFRAIRVTKVRKGSKGIRVRKVTRVTKALRVIKVSKVKLAPKDRKAFKVHKAIRVFRARKVTKVFRGLPLFGISLGHMAVETPTPLVMLRLMTAKLGIESTPMVAIPATRQAREHSGHCLPIRALRDSKVTKAFRVKLDPKAQLVRRAPKVHRAFRGKLVRRVLKV